ncbi:MupA/Atu3671 family FMN-dependent luciferase-like monooxygenase [Corallococcus llansteffanensis]|uniref:LLM class flavin-dependent oxidoreductase n=1 Tax=Corallococcus llansteffanensis TaxID=2316731 RepID=A0A3A8QIQ1_9BACT|nr:MupA/Atu3671 family FMN-dependent luciferase-like monooxygenase [Corallococcus llansteffanensis]RKH68629.1 LLM class flavin-dependent oxidoreductase [Corallococcus llansteffanensis]
MNPSTVAETVEARLREVLGAAPSLRIDPNDTFDRYGLDSIAAFRLSRLLGTALGLEVEVRAVAERPTIASLTSFLVAALEQHGGSPGPSPEAAPRATGAQPAPSNATVPETRPRAEAVQGPPARSMLIDELLSAFSRSPQLLDALSARLGAAPAPSVREPPVTSAPWSAESLGFSFIFFSTTGQRELASKYGYVTQVAKYADAHGFEALWIPERHFLPFGGSFPDPAILLSHIAAETKRIRLRSGSVVLPLHHPARVAESWAMLDNLSGGRVDMAFASGWNPNDFILSPDTYATMRQTWVERMALVRRLWRGESVEFRNGKGEAKSVAIYPRPVQPDLNVWMTVTSKPESFIEAGRNGYNILTMLQSRSVEQLRDEIASYRRARQENGFDPDTGRVTLMLHSYVHPDAGQVRRTVEAHFLSYIESGLRGHIERMEKKPTEQEIRQIAEHSFHHQYQHSALFGDVEHCVAVAHKMRAAGVNEIACLVDFGPSEEEIYGTLPFIREVMARVNTGRAVEPLAPSPRPAVSEPARAELRRAPESTPRPAPEYAIIGMSGRYPEARTLSEFWDNLVNNRNAIRKLDAARLADMPPGAAVENRHFGLLDGVYRFDAAFFGLSEREAELMDPHMRILLEEVWLCIENAGYSPRELAGSRTGIFVSFYNYEYSELLDGLSVEASSEPYLATATAGTIMANRISYLLGLRGPSEVYNTACSSGLVAVHRAVQAIAAGDCDQAIVAGVNLLLTGRRVRALSRMGILSEGGVCNPYSHPANGEILGEGAGALWLKPLRDAVAHRDFVYSVICGTDVGHPGRASGSLTMPSAEALAELMAKTYQRLQVDGSRISYIEGHGSGNATDVVELVAFQKLLGTLGGAKGKVPVGSVKSNIGFGEASGGIAQVTRCALSLSHGLIPATLHFERTDPSFAIDASPITVPTSNTPLEQGSSGRHYMSSVAYGLGGTCAHVVMRDHEHGAMAGAGKSWDGEVPLPFSARTPELLVDYVQRIAARLRDPTTRRHYERLCGSERALLESLSSTLAPRERNEAYRVVFLARSLSDLLHAFDAFAHGEERNDIVTPRGGLPSHDFRALGDVCVERRLARELAVLWVSGAEVSWTKLRDGMAQKLPLPPAPLAGKWLRLARKDAAADGPALEKRLLVTREPEGVVVELPIRVDDYFIAQHIVDGRPIMPATGYLGLLSMIVRTVFERGQPVLRDVTWLAPFEVTEEPVLLRIEFTAKGRFRAYRRQGVATSLCCSGRMDLAGEEPAALDRQLDPPALTDAKAVVDADAYWRVADSVTSKQQHGPLMRRIESIQRVGDSLVGVMSPVPVPVPLPDIALLDSALGVTLAFGIEAGETSGAALAFTLEELHSVRPFPTSGALYAVARRRAGAEGTFDISIEDEAGVCSLLRGFSARSFEGFQRRRNTLEASPPRPAIEHAVESAQVEGAWTPEGEVSLKLKKLIAAFLKVDAASIPELEVLESLGLDSIAVHELAAQAGDVLGIELPVAVMYQGRCVRDISRLLVDKHGHVLSTPGNGHGSPEQAN